MLSHSRTRRIVTAALVAAAVGPLGAASANAATRTVSDDTAAELTAGTTSDTVVRPDGAVELARTLEETFGGTALPAGWTSTPWQSGGTSTVAAGAILVDGARADSGVAAGPGSSLEFQATLGTQSFTHVGFATDFDQQPWAMFSTNDGPTGTVYARTSDAGGPDVNVDTPIPGIVASEPHAYRIDWTQTGFEYSVDGTLVATHPIALTAPMRAQASDYNPSGGGVSVESMILNTHKLAGTFTSRALDAGDARVSAVSLTAVGDTPDGTAIAYETRTAATATALTSASWAPVGAGGAVASSPARYLQYRASLSASNAPNTPRLDRVDVAFTVDDAAPKVTIGGVTVTGATARVTFSSDDAAAVTRCKLDGATFGDCTSPAEFSGLGDGSHTITVRATDTDGNVGSDAKTFVVDTRAPAVAAGDAVPAPASAAAPPATAKGGAPVDVTAPKVRVSRTVTVSKRGIASVRVSCPQAEAQCRVTVKLKRAGKWIARKTLMVSGFTTRTFALRLSKATRSKLAGNRWLKVAAVVSARDKAGNSSTKQSRMTLLASSR